MDSSTDTLIFFSPRLGEPSPIWVVPLREGNRQSSIKRRNYLFLFLRTLVMSVLALFNRLVDVLGYGDSLVLELRRVNPR